MVTPTVYMIIRVFNVGTQDINLRAYLDPETLRQGGQLVFTEETWSVVPAQAPA
jgi:hypothetical protein